MRQGTLGIAMVLASVVVLVSSALAEESRATVRTRAGDSYEVSNPTLEVFHTLGEPKERRAEPTGLQSSITFTSSTPYPSQQGDQPAGGEPGADTGKEKLLRGHSRLTELVVWRQGVEIRIPWNRLRNIRLARQPVFDSGLPPYVPHYRYSASVSLVDGEQVEADYVNLGTALLRGSRTVGRIDIPWEEIEYVTFER
jgi:hypothetical protein